LLRHRATTHTLAPHSPPTHTHTIPHHSPHITRSYAAKAISATLFHGDWGQFADYPIYLYFLIGGVAVSGQVRYLNKGLQFFDAMSVVPVFEAAIILSNSVAGIVYYRDLRDQSTGKKLAFAAGALMSIAGVNILLLKARHVGAGGAHGGGEGKEGGGVGAEGAPAGAGDEDEYDDDGSSPVAQPHERWSARLVSDEQIPIPLVGVSTSLVEEIIQIVQGESGLAPGGSSSSSARGRGASSGAGGGAISMVRVRGGSSGGFGAGAGGGTGASRPQSRNADGGGGPGAGSAQAAFSPAKGGKAVPDSMSPLLGPK
jgi:hypothetical protein